MTEKSKPVLVMLGIMGQTPFAGVAWQVLHYLEGFRRCGYDVYYVEDTGDWPYDPEQNAVTGDCRYTVNYLARLMEWAGFPNRWAYRFGGDGQTFGLSESEVAELFKRADVLVNLTASTWLFERHLSIPVRIYLETDPVLRQIEVAQGRHDTTELLRLHTHHFSYGENFGAPDCRVPLREFTYHPTRQPIVLDWWTPEETAGSHFTTIASWKQSGKDIEWDGETYTWSKHFEFLKFLELPQRSGQHFELALACQDADDIGLLNANGWGVIDGLALSKDVFPYRAYIRGSRGEFTVAKDQNIRLRSGWFSDRSACYLAAGLPVVTQETGFSNVFPTGKGLFGFSTMAEAEAAMEEIARDYEGNRRAAREIAAEYFAAEKVTAEMLDRAGLPVASALSKTATNK
ncbi:MAG TPA: hypothetical protein PLD20_26620 [Blastocatellia bacterium]|nr:hypothetical protein [Blastocatellia bacterium]HMY76447.1 hypothetical protein [Blastocatellia bacterium]HMZ21536.1 hypothetical protein [Blastocatellia bacterium]HNG30367.1 hypothetical protein [Blastocatellia bacterium]